MIPLGQYIEAAIEVTNRRAIRQYRCDRCGHSINEGDKSTKVVFGVRRFDTIHEHCESVMNDREFIHDREFNFKWRDRAKEIEKPRAYTKGYWVDHFK